MRVLCLPWTILLVGIASTAADRDCNEQFTTVTAQEVQTIFGFFAQAILPLGADLATSLQRVTPLIQHDVMAAKVCLKCSDIGLQDLSTGALLNDSWYGFASYCNPNQYGWDATHSALLFAPLDNETGYILTGQLRGFVAGHDTEIDVDAGPTDSWPENVSTLLGNVSLSDTEKIVILQPFVSSLAAATAGAVAILPDYIGYGESKDFDRAFLFPLPYMQAARLSYAAARRFVAGVGQDCAALVDTATVTGYGEGGYFATVGALALEQSGVTILSCRPGGTPFEIDVQLGFISGLDTPSTPLQLFLSFFGYAYSNDFPFMTNSLSGQNALHPSWMDPNNPSTNVVSWFSSLSALTAADLISLLPAEDFQGMLNPAMVAMYEESVFEGSLTACRDGTYVTDATMILCEVISGAGLWDTIANDVTFPLSICHSPYDDVIGFENVPNPAFLPQNIRIYSTEMEDFNPKGGHFESYFLCSLDPILHIAATPSGSSSPVWRQPLASVPEQCITNDPTSVTQAPSPSCGVVYDSCDEASQPCCAGLQCKVRTLDGAMHSICSPPGRTNGNKGSIAEPGIGGSMRGRERGDSPFGS
jgi:hypothetical protein